jgi:hypothetical protein
MCPEGGEAYHFHVHDGFAEHQDCGSNGVTRLIYTLSLAWSASDNTPYSIPYLVLDAREIWKPVGLHGVFTMGS